MVTRVLDVATIPPPSFERLQPSLELPPTHVHPHRLKKILARTSTTLAEQNISSRPALPPQIFFSSPHKRCRLSQVCAEADLLTCGLLLRYMQTDVRKPQVTCVDVSLFWLQSTAREQCRHVVQGSST